MTSFIFVYKKIGRVLLFSFLFFVGSLSAEDKVYTGFFSNVAIKGYDTVAYFTQGKAVKGQEKFSTDYEGAVWYFSSEQHKQLFLQNPEKYAPQYGGYCAYAVAHNDTASVQTELFTIYQGKLYLNYNEEFNEKWLQKKEQFIKQADKNWPSVLDK